MGQQFQNSRQWRHDANPCWHAEFPQKNLGPFGAHSQCKTPRHSFYSSGIVSNSYAHEVECKICCVHSNGDQGARIDFLLCLIEDGYGLGDLRETPSTVLDIGANQGFFALAARSFFPTASIHCYEPNPRILPILGQNAAAAQAEVFSEAVVVTAGTVFLEESGDSNQTRTTSVAIGTAVPQVSLRTAVERLGGKVDLAKIDCEGAEWEMFRDPEPWKAIRHLRMEYHLIGEMRFTDVQFYMSEFGFKIRQHYPACSWGTVWAER